MSGMVKLLSGDPTWRDLTALGYHYLTQPLPTPIAWYMDQLPAWFQKASTAFVFFVEVVVPFAIFASIKLRRMAGILSIGLQELILLTGNYTFFNWLTIALCVFLFVDGRPSNQAGDAYPSGSYSGANGVRADFERYRASGHVSCAHSGACAKLHVVDLTAALS